MHQQSMSGVGKIIDEIEETSIAVCLGLMTVITFANVIARYLFNSNILWALELTVFLFAWLVLMGASYAVKKHIHIGVDVVINMVSAPVRKVMAILSVSACLAFSGRSSASVGSRSQSGLSSSPEASLDGVA